MTRLTILVPKNMFASSTVHTQILNMDYIHKISFRTLNTQVGLDLDLNLALTVQLRFCAICLHISG